MQLGVDLGGSKIEILALDSLSGQELFRRRIATPRGSYGGLLQAVVDLVVATERELGSQGSLGIGLPGAEDPRTGLIKNANTTELIGKAFRQDLEASLKRPVRVANDANCLTLSEALDGAAKGEPVVFGVILGTGCGGGVVAHGQLLVGRHAIAGEWGHNPLPFMTGEEFPGSACYCGRRGCIETFVSGPGLARDFATTTGRTADARSVCGLASHGDAEAEAALDRLEHRLARSLAGVINLLDPHCIVIGGGLSNVARIFTNVPKLWSAFIFNHGPVTTRLVPAQFGDSSGVRGAARLWQLAQG